MADQEQYQEDQGQDTTPRRQAEQFPQRSTASHNWRSKDDLPRSDAQPRRGNRESGQYGSRPAFGGQGQSREGQTSDTRLYVGNLLYSAQKDDVAQFFNENGFNVTSISMSIDPMTGRNPSYCFADFESADDASRAMAELNGRDVLGRAVRINPGVAKRRDGEQGGEQRTSSFGRGGGGFGREQQQDGQRQPYGRGYNSRPEGQSYSSYNNRDRDRDNQESQGQGTGKRLYIGNLPNLEPQSEAEAAITGLFSALGIEVTNVSKLIAPHESKGPGDHYYLFVDLARAEDVDAAIETFDGKTTSFSGATPLRVNKAREQSGRRPMREGVGGGYGRGDRDGQQAMGQGQGQGQGGYRERRTEGFRDWRTSRQETGQ